ncbi:unnamed protein product [Paramecium sonneborni]|uniref:WD40-repeat-containing domain n=1 Tax=Paramecium sonneborni TaxID=65129 RepID=A0A8S1KT54_9CILI|nr:unnamed protein product [Paramecium sonneborni]
MQLIFIQYCPIKNYLIYESKDGYLSVFEIEEQEKQQKKQSIFFTQNSQQYLFLSTQKKINLYVLYLLETHNQEITKIQLFDSKGVFIRSNKDNAVKFWQFQYFPHILLNISILLFQKEPVVEHKVIRQQDDEQNKY